MTLLPDPSAGGNMESIEERLTEEVRKHVHLYDALSPHYKDTQMAGDSWRDISTVVGLDVLECARRWKMLRDKYVRFHKKMEARGSKTGGKIVPAFYLFLSWLAPHVKHRENPTSSADKVLTFTVSGRLVSRWTTQ